MKTKIKMKGLLVVALGMIGAPLVSKAQGIEFMHNLDSALAKAKAENKIVFVDFYTSWCAPCKQMSAEVFPQEKVGSFYNQQFINCKVQCDDKGVGVELGKKYQVNAYPTLMYLNQNGEEIHSAAGGVSAGGFIELGKIALNPDRNMFKLIKQWKAGNREEEFVKKYFSALKEAYRGETLNTDFALYFDGLSDKDKLKKSTFDLIKFVNPAPFTPAYTYLEDHKTQYHKTIGKDEFDKFIANTYLWYLKGLINPETRKEYEVAMAKFKAKKYPYYDEYAMFYSAFEVQDRKTGDINVNEFMKRGDAFLQKYGKNNDQYTLALTMLLGNCTGKQDQTVMGIKWMEDLLQRNRNPKYLNAYFYIVVRNYQCDKALEIGKEMRDNAIKNHQPTKPIDDQIASIDLYRAALAKRAAAANQTK